MQRIRLNSLQIQERLYFLLTALHNRGRIEKSSTLITVASQAEYVSDLDENWYACTRAYAGIFFRGGTLKIQQGVPRQRQKFATYVCSAAGANFGTKLH